MGADHRAVRLSLAVFAVLGFLTTMLTAGCAGGGSEDDTVLKPADSPSLPGRGFFMGVLPQPADGQSFDQAYLLAAQYAEFSPVWGRPSSFHTLADDLAGWWGETFVEGLTRGSGMFPLVHLSFMGAGLTLELPQGMDNAALDDPAWRSAYKQAALDVVTACRPLYLSLGNEVNRWFDKYGAVEGDPNGFQHYVTLYEETYDAVKRLSPETRVFCVFAREIVSQNREADLSVLDMFDPSRLDLIVLTSYPYAVQGINRPSDIPDEYYSGVLGNMADRPFGFSELGWPSIEAFGGELGQANFLTDVVGRLTTNEGLDLHLLGWPWLHDLGDTDRTGLIARDGTPKLAYQVWREISVR